MNGLDYIDGQTGRIIPYGGTGYAVVPQTPTDPEVARELANLRRDELVAMQRMMQTKIVGDISIGQTQTVSAWLSHRAVGEHNYTIETELSESGRGIFGGLGKTLSVKTSVHIS